jgi:hypothetical protein
VMIQSKYIKAPIKTQAFGEENSSNARNNNAKSKEDTSLIPISKSDQSSNSAFTTSNF